jgi:imidazole glycerol-phosphate synthase subunit HisF
MLQSRIIPCLLLKNRGLVKGVRFRGHQYIGDPINAVRIFNDKEVDEIVFLDIAATNEQRDPDYELIKDIAGECFIPLSYGGGINSLSQAAKIFSLGAERVIVNTAAIKDPALVSLIANEYGSQSVIVAVDVKKNFLGRYQMITNSGKKASRKDLLGFVKQVEDFGAGEILLTSVDRDGTGDGFDLALLKEIAAEVSIPVIIAGGAGRLTDVSDAFRAGASGVAVGSMFVFYGKHRAVLITYPTQSEINQLINSKEV